MGVGEGKTVLVVDDDASLRLLCRVNLELDGFRVLEAGSLAEGTAMLAAGEFDAVLLDLHLRRPRLARDKPVALFTGSETIGPELRGRKYCRSPSNCSRRFAGCVRRQIR